MNLVAGMQDNCQCVDLLLIDKDADMLANAVLLVNDPKPKTRIKVI